MMSYVHLIFQGFAIGMMASVPLGPIGVMCVQRTINNKFLSGFVSGCGAATADVVFATIALLFFTIVSPYLDSHIEILKGIGGLIITIIGAILFFRKGVPHIRKNRNKKLNLIKDFFSIFALTISNPAYILVFFGLFSYMKIGDMNFTLTTHLILLCGILIGASSWWFILTALVNSFRKKIRVKHIYYINKVAGMMILLLGLLALISGVFMHFTK